MIEAGALLWIPEEWVGDMIQLKDELTLWQRPAKVWNPDAVTVAVPLWRARKGQLGVPRDFGFHRHPPESFRDHRAYGRPISLEFTGPLGGPDFEQQPAAVDRIIELLNTRPSGGTILQAPCGYGKTVMGIAIACRMGVTTVVLVHKEFLAEQWEDRLLSNTPIRRNEIGRVQGDRCELSGKKVVIAMVQSLMSRDYGPLFRDWGGLLIVDEVHRMAAPEWGQAVLQIPARYRLGLSATPKRSDGLQRSFLWHIGPVGSVIDAVRIKPQAVQFYLPKLCPYLKKGKTPLASPMVSLLAGTSSKAVEGKAGRESCSRPNAGSVKRNSIIVAEVIRAARADRKILALSDRLVHLREMMLAVHSALPKVTQYRYMAGMTRQQRDDAEKCQILWATYGMVKEGLDIAELDTLVLTLPKGDVEQAVGRIQRVFDGKKDPMVLDFVDPVHPFKRMGERRLNYYREQGFEVQGVSRG